MVNPPGDTRNVCTHDWALNSLDLQKTVNGMPDGVNMADMFGMVMEMQKKMKEAQENLASKTVTAESGGGMVKVTANGARRITNIRIEPSAVDPEDVELLEDLVVAGINKALDEAEEMANKEMGGIAGTMLPPGMGLSGLPGLNL